MKLRVKLDEDEKGRFLQIGVDTHRIYWVIDVKQSEGIDPLPLWVGHFNIKEEIGYFKIK